MPWSAMLPSCTRHPMATSILPGTFTPSARGRATSPCTRSPCALKTAFIRQRIKAVFRAQGDLVHGDVARPLALGVKVPGRIEVAIGWRVQLGSIALQGMSAELGDIDCH